MTTLFGRSVQVFSPTGRGTIETPALIVSIGGPLRRTYIIDRLIPEDEISFVFGPPGVGKSRLLFQIATYVLDGQPFPFAGHLFETQKVGIGYAAYDRSTKAVGDLLEDYRLHNRIKWKSLRNLDNPEGRNQIPISSIPGMFPDCKLILIEAIMLAMPGGKSNDYCSVGNFVRYCGTVAERAQRTLIGIAHTPKPKPDATGKVNPRTAMLGSTATAGIGECMVNMAPEDLSDPQEPHRIVDIMPHDGPSYRARYRFGDDGRLVETLFESENAELALFFDSLPDHFTTFEALVIADRLAIKRRTAERHLAQLVKSGYLRKDAQGRYSKPTSIAGLPPTP